MEFDTEKVIDVLFDGIPHSKKTDKIKEDISSALYKEYSRIAETQTELKAVGEVMQKYGSLDEAAELAGYDKKHISEIRSPGNTVGLKDCKKVFRRQRIISYALSLFSDFTVISAFDIILNFHWIYIVTTVFFGTTAVFSALKYRRYFKEAHNAVISPEAEEYMRIRSDSYSKKLINSIFINFTFAFSISVMLFYFYHTLNSKNGESIEQLNLAMGYLDYAIYFFLKNLFCRNMCRQYVTDRINDPFFKSIKLVSIFSALYWAAVTVFMIVLIYFKKYSFNLLMMFMFIYGAGILCYNFTVRSNTVFKNIRRNLKRAAAYILAFCIVFTYQFMGMDSYIIQPYISSVPKIERTPDEISYDDETGVYTITTEKNNFRILQLTDIHLGGSIVSANKDIKALKTVYDLIAYSKPDLVVITGDMVFPMGIMSFSRNNSTPIIQFADFMRNMDIPWAFTYGNHDTEAIATESAESLNEIMKSISYKSSGNFLYPYVQPDIWGRNNQMIEIRNSDGTLMQALFLIDSNAYTEGGGVNEYDYIHDDQVEWYEHQIKKLNDSEGKTVPSMAFFHIPLQEYKEAYELYTQGSEEVTYYYGTIGESMIDPICCSDYPSTFFDRAVKLGSTKAMFCGHDHYNNLSVEYKGIRLTYGYNIDYLAMPGIENDTEQRGATIIDIAKNGEFEIIPVQYKNIKNSKINFYN